MTIIIIVGPPRARLLACLHAAECRESSEERGS